MSGVSSVNGYGAASYYTSALSSGKRINTAADGAAEMAILQEQERIQRGYDVGAENMQAAKSVANISDGALGSITDSLQRIKELSIQASNGLYSDEDKAYIQDEIEQLKAGIADVAGRTNYNGINLLDGSQGEALNIMRDSDGNSSSLTLANGTLSALGIEDYDVTGEFDMSQLDEAMARLSSSRATIGAQSNATDHAINSNRTASYNASASASAIGDTEYGEYVNKLQKANLLNTISIQMQKRQQEQKAGSTLGLL